MKLDYIINNTSLTNIIRVLRTPTLFLMTKLATFNLGQIMARMISSTEEQEIAKEQDIYVVSLRTY